jgi:acyl CoA:acetate/3-ketoacid CoA transferase
VIELTKDGLMIVEIAPGVNLEQDILSKSDFLLLVSPNLATTNLDIYKELAAQS